MADPAESLDSFKLDFPLIPQHIPSSSSHPVTHHSSHVPQPQGNSHGRRGPQLCLSSDLIGSYSVINA